MKLHRAVCVAAISISCWDRGCCNTDDKLTDWQAKVLDEPDILALIIRTKNDNAVIYRYNTQASISGAYFRSPIEAYWNDVDGDGIEKVGFGMLDPYAYGFEIDGKVVTLKALDSYGVQTITLDKAGGTNHLLTTIAGCPAYVSYVYVSCGGFQCTSVYHVAVHGSPIDGGCAEVTETIYQDGSPRKFVNCSTTADASASSCKPPESLPTPVPKSVPLSSNPWTMAIVIGSIVLPLVFFVCLWAVCCGKQKDKKPKADARNAKTKQTGVDKAARDDESSQIELQDLTPSSGRTPSAGRSPPAGNPPHQRGSDAPGARPLISGQQSNPPPHWGINAGAQNATAPGSSQHGGGNPYSSAGPPSNSYGGAPYQGNNAGHIGAQAWANPYNGAQRGPPHPGSQPLNPHW